MCALCNHSPHDAHTFLFDLLDLSACTVLKVCMAFAVAACVPLNRSFHLQKSFLQVHTSLTSCLLKPVIEHDEVDVTDLETDIC